MGILTVTLNPALDLETETPRLVPGQKLRCAAPRRDPGGGGINVSRAIAILGGRADAAIAVAGPIGAGLVQQLEGQGIRVHHLPAPGETRQNLSVIETETGQQFRFIFPGPDWGPEDVTRLLVALPGLALAGDFVVLSGSLPPGVDAQVLVDLARVLTDRGVRVIADTSGPALAALAGAGLNLAMLRMDSAEAEDLLSRELSHHSDSARTAEGLVRAGAAEIVILARGAEGSVLVSSEGRWFAPAADVPVASVTGAGDSFVAGAVLALSRGQPLPEVLQCGVAAASSAVTTAATELCDRATYERLLPLCAARPV
ncbi:Tagatose-6-phosphate kinase / 1-phosphofructokinase [Roseibacterium elongatum DSM 19469]|uniref:Phosphofructokinase n=1 Tax=Roseicyclus elongatus DSM 19469 TaxID=1294273 RepID=W8S8I2_9RHOB|nr:hexose kinase [Roseibacterium elongatum]AHM05286.1 Tagatose-6-phosphate kinase / 1-phosphofructokinase [Roseibacterium elongatum DSM 19469]